jgi:hypothetical protein
MHPSPVTGIASLFFFFFTFIEKKVDRLCGLVGRVPGYRTEMYCVSCEIRTEFIYVEESRTASVV